MFFLKLTEYENDVRSIMPSSPAARNISQVIPDGPAALQHFILLRALRMESKVTGGGGLLLEELLGVYHRATQIPRSVAWNNALPTPSFCPHHTMKTRHHRFLRTSNP